MHVPQFLYGTHRRALANSRRFMDAWAEHGAAGGVGDYVDTRTSAGSIVLAPRVEGVHFHMYALAECATEAGRFDCRLRLRLFDFLLEEPWGPLVLIGSAYISLFPQLREIRRRLARRLFEWWPIYAAEGARFVQHLNTPRPLAQLTTSMSQELVRHGVAHTELVDVRTEADVQAFLKRHATELQEIFAPPSPEPRFAELAMASFARLSTYGLRSSTADETRVRFQNEEIELVVYRGRRSGKLWVEIVLKSARRLKKLEVERYSFEEILRAAQSKQAEASFGQSPATEADLERELGRMADALEADAPAALRGDPAFFDRLAADRQRFVQEHPEAIIYDRVLPRALTAFSGGDYATAAHLFESIYERLNEDGAARLSEAKRRVGQGPNGGSEGRKA